MKAEVNTFVFMSFSGDEVTALFSKMQIQFICYLLLALFLSKAVIEGILKFRLLLGQGHFRGQSDFSRSHRQEKEQHKKILLKHILKERLISD